MMRFAFTLIAALWLTFASGQAQEELKRFRAFPVFGMNMTQVDGDDLAGFQKLGFHAGAGVHIMINKKFSTSVEILFNQKGSKSKPNDLGASLKLTLNYAEVPIQFNFHDKDRMIFGAGFAIGNLVNSKLDINGLDDPEIKDALEKWEFSYLFTATFLVKKNIGIGFRYSGSLTSIGTSNISNLKGNNMRNKVISIRTSYLF